MQRTEEFSDLSAVWISADEADKWVFPSEKILYVRVEKRHAGMIWHVETSVSSKTTQKTLNKGARLSMKSFLQVIKKKFSVKKKKIYIKIKN